MFLRGRFRSPNSSTARRRRKILVFSMCFRSICIEFWTNWKPHFKVQSVHQTRPFRDFKAPLTKLVRTSLVSDNCTGWWPGWTWKFLSESGLGLPSACRINNQIPFRMGEVYMRYMTSNPSLTTKACKNKNILYHSWKLGMSVPCSEVERLLLRRACSSPSWLRKLTLRTFSL